MNRKADDLSVFTKLGMTIRQAEVYMAISDLEQAKVKTIAKTVQTDRAEIYRVLPKLQKLGLIKKVVTAPASYRAVPLSEGLSILLQRNAEKHEEIQSEAEQFLEKLKDREKTNKEECQYTLTSGVKSIDREFLRHLEETKTSLDSILEWEGILYMVNMRFKEHAKALERDVKFRYITHMPKGEKLPEIIQTLKEKGDFEIRNTATSLKAGITIHDKKSFAVVTFSKADLKEMEALFSNNHSVAKLVQDLFELKWHTTTLIEAKNTK